MNTYYFTFGDSENFPYKNGWVEIVADNEIDARNFFSVLYPTNDYLRCSSVYDEEQFKKTVMYKDGNFGARCHKRFVFKEEEVND